MKQAKEYVFKPKSIIFDLIITIIFMALVIFLFFNLYRSPFALLLIGAIPCTLLYFQFYTLFITFQFNSYDKGKKIIIDDNRSNLKLIQGDNTTSINNSEVNKVEIYEQRSLGKFGSFNYLVIYTNNDIKLLITQFTIPRLAYDNILQSFLRKNRRINIKKTFNYIDQEKFKLP